VTWREHLIVRILLIIARMVAPSDALSAELKTLATHISVHVPKEPA
jgi:hypothetical protein